MDLVSENNFNFQENLDNDDFNSITYHPSSYFACRIDMSTARIHDIDEIRKSEDLLQLKLKTPYDVVSRPIEPESIYFKTKLSVGMSSVNDIVVEDNLVSDSHCVIDTSRWNKKDREWRQAYLIILRLRLPLDITRNIVEFIKEPGYLTIRDLNSQIGTFVSLRQNLNFEIFKDQRYVLGHSVELSIPKVREIELKGDKYECLSNEIQKDSNAKQKSFVICHDNLLDFQSETLKCSILTVQLRSADKKIQKHIYHLVSVGSEKKFLIGKGPEASVRFNCRELENYQCEIFFQRGKWYLSDWGHDSNNKRTWLSVKHHPNGLLKFNGNIDISIGRSYLTISPLSQAALDLENTSSDSQRQIAINQLSDIGGRNKSSLTR